MGQPMVAVLRNFEPVGAYAAGDLRAALDQVAGDRRAGGTLS